MPETKKTAHAVASIYEGYWRTEEAKTYVRENAEAVKRGVEFIRIFVFPTKTLRRMVDILEEQAASGIKVYVAWAEHIPEELKQDYILLDDQVAYYTLHPGQSRKLTVAKDEIEQTAKRFEVLLRHASTLDHVIDNLKRQE